MVRNPPEAILFHAVEHIEAGLLYRASDPGTVEGNVVFTYLDAFASDAAEVEDLKARYRCGGLGDIAVKRYLDEVLQTLLAPIGYRRAQFASDPSYVMDILRQGTLRAKERTQSTLDEMRAGLGLFSLD